MDKKEIKKNAAELNDDALEKVSGGEYQRLLKPIILGDEGQRCEIHCVVCGRTMEVTKGAYENLMASGGYYCDECKAKRM